MILKWGIPVFLYISIFFIITGAIFSLLLIVNIISKKRFNKNFLRPGIEKATWTIPLRLVLIGIILAFMADPRLEQDFTTGDNLVFVIDTSASVAVDQTVIESYIKKQIKNVISHEGHYGLIMSGENSIVSTPFPTRPDMPPQFLWNEASKMQMGSNISEGLTMARMALGISQGGTIVLLTDGHTEKSSLIRKSQLIKANGYDLEIIELPCNSPKDIFLRSIIAPNSVRENNEVTLRAILENTGKSTKVKVGLWLDNKEIDSRIKTLYKGTDLLEFSFPAYKPGNHILRIKVEPDDKNADTIKDNNIQYASFTVENNAKILFVEGSKGISKQLKIAITGSMVSHQTINSHNVKKGLKDLKNIDIIALLNVPARDLPEDVVDILKDYVLNGGGLVLFGGSQSFELGGYYGSPIERLLPVISAVEHPSNDRAVGIFILLIDVSGSMHGRPLQLAKQVGKAAIERLKMGMAATVITFDANAAYVAQPVVINPTVQDDLIKKVNNLSGGGGTDIVPAMQKAIEALKECRKQVNRKDLAAHILVVSDGEAGNVAELKQLAQSFVAQDCKVHTVRIGGGPSYMGNNLMKELAKAGEGRAEIYAGVEVPFFELTDDEIEEEKARMGFIQVPDDILFTNSISRPGILSAMAWDYNRIEKTKRSGRISLLIEDQKHNPIYVWRYYGNNGGRVMTCLIDIEGIWSKGLLKSELAHLLLGEPLYFTQRPEKKNQVRAFLKEDPINPDVLTLTVHGDLKKDVTLSAVEKSHNPVTVPLLKKTPSIFQGKFRNSGNKRVYKFRIVQKGRKKSGSIGEVWTVFNPKNNLEEFVGNVTDKENLILIANMFDKELKTMDDIINSIKKGKRTIIKRPWSWWFVLIFLMLLLVGTLVRVRITKIFILFILFHSALSPTLYANWWSKASISQRSDDWFREAFDSPEYAAELIIYLGKDPRRTQAVFTLLNKKPGFPSALYAILRANDSVALDKAIAVGKDQVTGNILDILNTTTVPVIIRARCIRILKYAEHPSLWSHMLLIIEKETDINLIKAAVSAIIDSAPHDQTASDRLLKIVKNTTLSIEQRELLYQSIGNFKHPEIINFLINEGLHQNSPELQIAALYALQKVSLTVRQANPGGYTAELLKEGANQLWEDGKNDTKFLGATAAVLWLNLNPARFDKILSKRVLESLFWIETAKDDNAIRTWTLAISERWRQMSDKTIELIRLLVSVGQDENTTNLQRKSLLIGLNSAFPEWPIVVSVDAFDSNNREIKYSGTVVLTLIGNLDDVTGLPHLSYLTWDMDESDYRAAIKNATKTDSPLKWAGYKIVSIKKSHRELWPFITAYSNLMQDIIVNEIIKNGSDTDIKKIVQIGNGNTLIKGLKAMSMKGDVNMALQWAEADPESFLDNLIETLNNNDPKKAAHSAIIIYQLINGSNIEDCLKILYPKGQLDRTRFGEEVCQTCIDIAKLNKHRYINAINSCLLQSPSEQRNAIIKKLKRIDKTSLFTYP